MSQQEWCVTTKIVCHNKNSAKRLKQLISTHRYY